MLKIEIDQNVDKQIIKKQGKDISLTIAMEECAELIQAISKLRRGKGNYENLAEECADVLICIDYLKQITHITDEEIQKWIDFKLDRALRRLVKLEL